MLKLGLRLALMDVLDNFCIGKTMTCDRCLVPAACIAYIVWLCAVVAVTNAFLEFFLPEYYFCPEVVSNSIEVLLIVHNFTKRFIKYPVIQIFKNV